MAVSILIPTALRGFAGGKSEVLVDAATAGEALAKLTTEHAALRKHLFSDDGKLLSKLAPTVAEEIKRGPGVVDVNNGLALAGDALDGRPRPSRAPRRAPRSPPASAPRLAPSWGPSSAMSWATSSTRSTMS